MASPILTTNSSITCPHMAKATLTTTNTKVNADNAPALLESDIHMVVGCPFTLPGPKPSPCLRIEWSAASTSCTVDGTGVLVSTSVGKCYSAEGAMQGMAIILNTQTKASG